MDTIPGESQGTMGDSTPVFGGFRLAAAVIGLLMIVAGAWFGCLIAYEIYRVLHEPKSFAVTLDKWELLVRGRMTVKTAEGANSRSPAPTNAGPEDPVTRHVEEFISVAARPLGAFFIILLVMVLIRVAVLLVDAGGRLVWLVVGEREVMKSILRELKSAPRDT